MVVTRKVNILKSAAEYLLAPHIPPDCKRIDNMLKFRVLLAMAIVIAVQADQSQEALYK